MRELMRIKTNTNPAKSDWALQTMLTLYNRYLLFF